MTFNPYLQHEAYMKEKEEAPLRYLKKGVSVVGAVAGGSSLLNRLLPLLSSHLPQEMARKGITKINPRLGNFVESATNLGHDFYSVRDFLRAKAAEEQAETQEKSKASENRNIVEQYSPQLHQFIVGEIQKGRSALEAGALAAIQEPFKRVIKKITDDHQSPFSSILETVYGSAQKAQSSASPGTLSGS